jgi:hypothetical protein
MDWGVFWTVIGCALGGIVFIYQILRNFKSEIEISFNVLKEDVNKKFEKHEKRFELIDQRLFLLCMGKSLPEILKSEREEKDRK